MAGGSDDRWAEVLAGRAAAADAATRQAASLRSYFERQAAEDLAAPVDPEGETRMLNALRARGVFEAARSLPGRANETARSRWLASLRSLTDARVARYSVAAAGVFAAVIVVPLLMQRPGEDDGSAVKGGVKPTTQIATDGEGLMMLARPEQGASQLVSAMALAGVAAESGAEGEDFVVRARIDADHAVAARQKLAEIGLAAPATGRLIVRFKKLP